jgi:hypothetical protein
MARILKSLDTVFLWPWGFSNFGSAVKKSCGKLFKSNGARHRDGETATGTRHLEQRNWVAKIATKGIYDLCLCGGSEGGEFRLVRSQALGVAGCDHERRAKYCAQNGGVSNQERVFGLHTNSDPGSPPRGTTNDDPQRQTFPR